MEIDETDRQILRGLLKNSRESYRKIARKLSITTNTVISRVNKMRKSKIIKGNTLMIDHEKLGFDLTAVIEIKTTGRMKEVADSLKKYFNVFSVYQVTGSTDVIIIGRFMNRKDLNSFVQELQKKEGIHRTITRVVFETVKEDLRVVI